MGVREGSGGREIELGLLALPWWCFRCVGMMEDVEEKCRWMSKDVVAALGPLRDITHMPRISGDHSFYSTFHSLHLVLATFLRVFLATACIDTYTSSISSV